MYVHLAWQPQATMKELGRNPNKEAEKRAKNTTRVADHSLGEGAGGQGEADSGANRIMAAVTGAWLLHRFRSLLPLAGKVASPTFPQAPPQPLSKEGIITMSVKGKAGGKEAKVEEEAGKSKIESKEEPEVKGKSATKAWRPSRQWMEETDWECSTATCGNINFGYRKACARCGGTAGKERAITEGKASQGNWCCHRCGTYNAVFRQKCREPTCKWCPRCGRNCFATCNDLFCGGCEQCKACWQCEEWRTAADAVVRLRGPVERDQTIHVQEERGRSWVREEQKKQEEVRRTAQDKRTELGIQEAQKGWEVKQGKRGEQPKREGRHGQDEQDSGQAGICEVEAAGSAKPPRGAAGARRSPQLPPAGRGGPQQEGRAGTQRVAYTTAGRMSAATGPRAASTPGEKTPTLKVTAAPAVAPGRPEPRERGAAGSFPPFVPHPDSRAGGVSLGTKGACPTSRPKLKPRLRGSQVPATGDMAHSLGTPATAGPVTQVSKAVVPRLDDKHAVP